MMECISDRFSAALGGWPKIDGTLDNRKWDEVSVHSFIVEVSVSLYVSRAQHHRKSSTVLSPPLRPYCRVSYRKKQRVYVRISLDTVIEYFHGNHHRESKPPSKLSIHTRTYKRSHRTFLHLHKSSARPVYTQLCYIPWVCEQTLHTRTVPTLYTAPHSSALTTYPILSRPIQTTQNPSTLSI